MIKTNQPSDEALKKTCFAFYSRQAFQECLRRRHKMKTTNKQWLAMTSDQKQVALSRCSNAGNGM